MGTFFGITGQFNYFCPSPYEFNHYMGLIGLRGTFGNSEDPIRLFIGTDCGAMDYKNDPIFGINSGLDFNSGNLGLYAKTSLRLARSDKIVGIWSFPEFLFEFAGGVKLNF